MRLSLLLVGVAALPFTFAGCVANTSDTGEATGSASAAYSVDPSLFSLPPSDVQSRTQILSRYTQIDPQGVVPRGLLEDALEFFDINKANIPVLTFVTVVDFSKFSGDLRLWVIDMQAGTVEPHMVAHGSGSDPNGTGYATTFSNIPGSYMSSLGFYLAGEIYDGTHIHSMRLDGLSPDGSPNNMANTNVRTRLVVMHEASYVSDSNTSAQGMSNGCFALDPSIEVSVVDRLHDGSLLYAEIAPLNPPVGPIPPPPPPPPPDAGMGGPDAAPPPADAGSMGQDAAPAPPPDSGSSGLPNSGPPNAGDSGSPSGNDAGGNGNAAGGGSSASGCRVAPGSAPATELGLGWSLLALAALRRRRRPSESQAR
jgi:MYXO-CTERM domain-containing protein